MTDQNNEMRATAREWHIALFVVIGGFVIAVAIAAYLLLRPPQSQPAAQTETPLTPAQRREMMVKVGRLLCDRELLNAKAIGVVPPYGRSIGLPMRTSTRGQYACTVSTGAAKYVIAADVLCSTLFDPRCVSIYSVTSDDSTVLFKRPDVKSAK
jgi:hypothetical protein